MNTRRLGMEHLERREVLSGNVVARVVNGEIRVTGDSKNNFIQVTELPGTDGTAKTFRLNGLPFDGNFNPDGTPKPGNSPTTINGSTEAVTLVSSLDSILTSLGDGNDVILLGSGGGVGGTLSKLSIDTGNGHDYAQVLNYNIYGTTAPVRLAAGSPSDNFIDDVRFVNSKVSAQALNILTGGGNDSVLMISASIGGALTVNGSSGNETVKIESFTLTGRTSLLLGEGTNAVTIKNASLKSVVVTGGASRDTVSAQFMEADNFTFTMNGGDDLLDYVQELQIFGTSSVNGGTGTDRFHRGNRVDPGSLNVTGVEQF